MGISIGGLVARHVLQACPIGKYVKRFITLSGPHMGVDKVPNSDISLINYVLF